MAGRAWAAPVITGQPADAATNVRGAAGFRVVAMGTAPVTYRWLKDGQAVANATSDTLMIPHAVARDAGRYSVQVSDAQGSATSVAAALTVQPAPEKPIVDPSFHGDPALTGAAQAFLPLTDGRVLVATTERIDAGAQVADRVRVGLIRLLADGRIDPTFRRGVPTIDEFEPQSEIYPPLIGKLVIQPDGRVLVAGHFAAFNGVACPGVVRLMPNGEVDPTFTAAPNHTSQNDRLYQASLALQSDGKILVFGYGVSGLMRLLPNGQVDATFVPDQFAGYANAVSVGAGGRLFVGTGLGVAPRGDGVVLALKADGTRDPAFTLYRCDAVWLLCALSDGGVMVSTQEDTGPILSGDTNRVRFPATTFRLRADGTVDTRFSLKTVPMTAAAADGTVLVGSTLIGADGVTETTLNLGSEYVAASYVFNQDSFFAEFDGKGGLWYRGGFTAYNGVTTTDVVHLNLVTTENLTPPTVLGISADATAVHYGDSITLRAAATGPGPLTYVWSMPFNGATITTTEPVVTFPYWASGVGSGGQFSVLVRNSAGSSATSAPVIVTVVPGELKIVAQPHQMSLTVGRVAQITLQLGPNSATGGTAVWKRNGVALNPGDGGVSPDFSRLGFGAARLDQAGTYTATLTDSLGQTVTSEPIVVTVGDSSRFTNLSVRAQVGTGERMAILGFVIPAGERRTVLLRGIGPSLAGFGVTGVLSAARLDLVDSAGRTVMRSKSWGTASTNASSTDFDRVGAFPLANGSNDAALDLNLAPGSYTLQLSGLNGVTGEGLIELYEEDNVSDRLSNISARVTVPAGSAAIAGFAIRGPVSKKVLVRAVGPGLTEFGVAGALGNPRVEIRDAGGQTVASNDDWQAQARAADVAATTSGLGAFALAPGSKDAALLTTLPPANYTAVVVGGTGETGVALVEVYEVP